MEQPQIHEPYLEMGWTTGAFQQTFLPQDVANEHFQIQELSQHSTLFPSTGALYSNDASFPYHDLYGMQEPLYWPSVESISPVGEPMAYFSPATLDDYTSGTLTPAVSNDSPKDQPLPPLELTRSNASKAERESTSTKSLSRKEQNRVAQQVHRDRKKKLIEDLWYEIHSLRKQNGQLQKQLKVKNEMLEQICQRLRVLSEG